MDLEKLLSNQERFQEMSEKHLNKIIDVLKYLSLIVGAVVLMFTIINIVGYLIKKKKYRVYSVLCQYVSAIGGITGMIGFAVKVPTDSCDIIKDIFLYFGICCQTIFALSHTIILTTMYF